VEAGESQVRGQPRQYCEFQANLSYVIIPGIKKKKKEKKRKKKRKVRRKNKGRKKGREEGGKERWKKPIYQVNVSE
jgi:hypothetical protein